MTIVRTNLKRDLKTVQSLDQFVLQSQPNITIAYTDPYFDNEGKLKYRTPVVIVSDIEQRWSIGWKGIIKVRIIQAVQVALKKKYTREILFNPNTQKNTSVDAVVFGDNKLVNCNIENNFENMNENERSVFKNVYIVLDNKNAKVLFVDYTEVSDELDVQDFSNSRKEVAPVFQTSHDELMKSALNALNNLSKDEAIALLRSAK